MFSAPPVPFIPGKDGAGIIEEVGPGVEKDRIGERVYIAGAVTGTYAGYAVVENGRAKNLPDNVSFEEGSGLFVPYATAYRALF